jgi:hypothetical protein
VEAGNVFLEVTEKRQLPDFRFFRRDGIGAWQRQKKAPGEKAAFRGTKTLGGDILSPIQEPKWKFWFKTIGFTLTDVKLAGTRFTSAVDPGWTKVLVDGQPQTWPLRILRSQRVVKIEFIK